MLLLTTFLMTEAGSMLVHKAHGAAALPPARGARLAPLPLRASQFCIVPFGTFC